MGSRLALLAAVQLIAAAVAVRVAAADTRARELYKRGVDEYKGQKYEAAAATLKEAYDLDPKPDVLFALAQAERLGGHCTEARSHYKKLLESTTEMATAKAVQSNLDLCGPDPDKPAHRQPEPEKPAPPPPPRTITTTRTVVREVRRTDKLATLLFAGGMLGLGAGGGLFLASKNSRDDADRALTLDDHDRLDKRADTLRVASFAAAGAGAALIGGAVVRWALGGGGETKTTEPKPEVSLAPSAHGAMVVLSAGW